MSSLFCICKCLPLRYIPSSFRRMYKFQWSLSIYHLVRMFRLLQFEPPRRLREHGLPCHATRFNALNRDVFLRRTLLGLATSTQRLGFRQSGLLISSEAKKNATSSIACFLREKRRTTDNSSAALYSKAALRTIAVLDLKITDRTTSPLFLLSARQKLGNTSSNWRFPLVTSISPLLPLGFAIFRSLLSTLFLFSHSLCSAIHSLHHFCQVLSKFRHYCRLLII